MNAATRVGLLVALMASSQISFAHGDVSCSTPKNEWKPRVELQKKLRSQGWAVRDIKIQNGCYEVYGFDEKSVRVEAFFDPKTFERVYPADAKPATVGK